MATLYRFHAADDSLLYVGITATGLQRVRGHASKSHWWPHVARATFEHDRTHEDELTAIDLERPLFNVDGTDRSDWVDTLQDAVSNGWLTDGAVLLRELKALVATRERLGRQLAEIDDRIGLIHAADRTNRIVERQEAERAEEDRRRRSR